MSSWEFVEIGSTVAGRYRLEARLGDSTARERLVLEAFDEHEGRACVVELFTTNALSADDRDALAQRVQQLQRIAHHQLVAPFDCGVLPEHDIYYVTTPLLGGADLGAISKQSGPVPPEQVAVWFSSTSEVLGALHAADCAHGQLSPSSLFLERANDGTPLIMLLDAEKGHWVGRDSATACGVGENGKSPLTKGDDVFALGRIAAALLGAEQSKVSLPNGFTRWLDKATAAEASERFDTVDDMARALLLALGVRQQDDGSMRQVIAQGEDPELDETLRPEDADVAKAAADDARVSASEAVVSSGKTVASVSTTLIDPLGDTHAGPDELGAAADAAIAEAERNKQAPPRIPHASEIADTLDDESGVLAPERSGVASAADLVEVMPTKPFPWGLVVISLAVVLGVVLALVL